MPSRESSQSIERQAARRLADTLPCRCPRADEILGHQIQFEIMSRVPIDQILELPAAERVELAQQIWESVFDHPEGVLLTTPQKEELERRWIAFEQNPDEGEPWEDVKRSLLDE